MSGTMTSTRLGTRQPTTASHARRANASSALVPINARPVTAATEIRQTAAVLRDTSTSSTWQTPTLTNVDAAPTRLARHALPAQALAHNALATTETNQTALVRRDTSICLTCQTPTPTTAKAAPTPSAETAPSTRTRARNALAITEI